MSVDGGVVVAPAGFWGVAQGNSVRKQNLDVYIKSGDLFLVLVSMELG